MERVNSLATTLAARERELVLNAMTGYGFTNPGIQAPLGAAVVAIGIPQIKTWCDAKNLDALRSALNAQLAGSASAAWLKQHNILDEDGTCTLQGIREALIQVSQRL